MRETKRLLGSSDLYCSSSSRSFSDGIDTFQPPNGRKGVEGVRSCRGTWHARRVHMTKQSQVTFHGQHFKAIIGFIMHGYAPRYTVGVD